MKQNNDTQENRFTERKPGHIEKYMPTTRFKINRLIDLNDMSTCVGLFFLKAKKPRLV